MPLARGAAWTALLMVSLLGASLSGCSDEQGGALIRSVGASLPTGRRSDEPFPKPTKTGSEPSISSASFKNTGSTSFNLIVKYQSTVAVSELHMDINGDHYIVDVPLPAVDAQGNIDACQIAASATGVSCTPACLKACACVECTNGIVGDNIEGSCAATCSIGVAKGTIGPGKQPYTSEAVYADIIYNGYTVSGTRVPGTLDSISGCNASACRAASDAEKSIEVPFVVQDWSFIGDLNVGALATSAPATESGPSIVSEGHAASLNPYMSCDPGPCRH